MLIRVLLKKYRKSKKAFVNHQVVLNSAQFNVMIVDKKFPAENSALGWVVIRKSKNANMKVFSY